MSLDFSLYQKKPVEVFESNITHNLTKMASEAGLYEYLWRPYESFKFTHAFELVDGLTEGLKRLEEDPEKFKKFNPENGWGSYESLVKFTKKVLEACIENPEAEIRISR